MSTEHTTPQTSSIVDVCIEHFADAPALRKSSGGIVLAGPESARGSRKDEALQRVDHIVAAQSESMAGSSARRRTAAETTNLL
jgi:hypothetical protein